MDYIFSSPSMKDRRQALRKSLGLPEIILWNQLKHQQLGVKFRRQYSIGSYVIDFYCHTKKLGIELDGNTHDNPQAYGYDKNRHQYIVQQGITLIHYTNHDLLTNLGGVVEDIKKQIR